MEISTPSALTNNIILPIVLNFNVWIFFNLFLYSIAVTSGVITANKIITLIFEEILKRLHHRWMTKYKDKKEVAIEVIRICTEGSTTGWNIKPRDIEHIYFIARLLEGIDKNASKLFDQCITSLEPLCNYARHTTCKARKYKFLQRFTKKCTRGV